MRAGVRWLGVAILAALGAGPAAAAPFVVTDAHFVGNVYELRYYTSSNQLFLNGVATALDATPLDDLFLTNASNTASPAWQRGSDFGAAFLLAPSSKGTSAAATMGWDLSGVSGQVAGVELLTRNFIFDFVPWNDEALGDSIFADVATPAAFGGGPYTNVYSFTSNNAAGAGPGADGSGGIADLTPLLAGAWLADPGLLELRFGYQLLGTDIPSNHLQLFRDAFGSFPTNNGFMLRITLASPVPEPGAAWLLACAALPWLTFARRGLHSPGAASRMVRRCPAISAPAWIRSRFRSRPGGSSARRSLPCSTPTRA